MVIHFLPLFSGLGSNPIGFQLTGSRYMILHFFYFAHTLDITNIAVVTTVGVLKTYCKANSVSS